MTRARRDGVRGPRRRQPGPGVARRRRPSSAWRCCTPRTTTSVATSCPAAGPGTFDINIWCTEIQAGSYTLMDTAYAKLGLPFRQALWVEATVISVSPKGWFVADCGLKALGMDHGDPSVDAGEVLFCSDEHITVRPSRGPARGSATGSGSGPRTSTRRSRCTSGCTSSTARTSSRPGKSTSGAGRRRVARLRTSARCSLRSLHFGPAPAYARPMTDDFATLDATAQAELVRTGQVSPSSSSTRRSTGSRSSTRSSTR